MSCTYFTESVNYSRPVSSFADLTCVRRADFILVNTYNSPAAYVKNQLNRAIFDTSVKIGTHIELTMAIVLETGHRRFRPWLPWQPVLGENS